GELDHPAAPETAVGLQPEREPVSRPELGAEHSKRQIGVRIESVEHRSPGVAVARPVTLELNRVRVGAAEQKRRLAVREERRRREVGVRVLEPALGELVAQLRVRRPADPERVPGTEDVVQVAGLGQLCGPNRASEVSAALEYAHTPTLASQQRTTRQ